MTVRCQLLGHKWYDRHWVTWPAGADHTRCLRCGAIDARRLRTGWQAARHLCFNTHAENDDLYADCRGCGVELIREHKPGCPVAAMDALLSSGDRR